MTADISHAVRGLLEARSTGIQMAPPFALPNRDAVYAIQDGVLRATGPAAGWKVGARTPTAEPNPAPLLAGALVKSPARFNGKAMHMIGVEIEISFHIVRDIAARANRSAATRRSPRWATPSSAWRSSTRGWRISSRPIRNGFWPTTR